MAVVKRAAKEVDSMLAEKRLPRWDSALEDAAQVSTILVATSSGMLLLTPSTTARHFSAWLALAARPFGFVEQPVLPFGHLYGDSFS